MTGLPRSAAVQVVVEAPPAAVWAVLADVTRVGEWSSEWGRARWLGGVSTPAVGARFRGYNRAGLVRWSREAEFVGVEPMRELRWRARGPALVGDSTQ